MSIMLRCQLSIYLMTPSALVIVLGRAKLYNIRTANDSHIIYSYFAKYERYNQLAKKGAGEGYYIFIVLIASKFHGRLQWL